MSLKPHEQNFYPPSFMKWAKGSSYKERRMDIFTNTFGIRDHNLYLLGGNLQIYAYFGTNKEEEIKWLGFDPDKRCECIKPHEFGTREFPSPKPRSLIGRKYGKLKGLIEATNEVKNGVLVYTSFLPDELPYRCGKEIAKFRKNNYGIPEEKTAEDLYRLILQYPSTINWIWMFHYPYIEKGLENLRSEVIKAVLGKNP